ncbi:MAG: FAD-binding oxidoreductase [Actinomycetota bacterium]|nr:FAD-binding oxidoreductase [Actinomycetota bacterium]MDA3034194.1 FAD-binding oxidoreductase [Actinomycetota bacterium]
MAATHRVSGWGNTTPVRVRLVDDAEVDMSAFGSRGAIPRGLGRAYGDAAQNSGGTVVRATGETIDLDDATGLVRVSAAVSIDELLRHVIPAGWFVPVSAGTRFVTIGGAIAADIHGKNHHRDGSFGDWVRSVRMLLASGDDVVVTPQSDPELFAATCGGMGLTGLIREATVQLIPVSSSQMAVSTRRCNDLDAVMSTMVDAEDTNRYTVAWVDATARGARCGRGIVTFGDHADDASGADPTAYRPRSPVRIPGPAVPLVNSVTGRIFSEMWFRRAPRARDDETMSIPAYFHPLDGVDRWNRVWGRRGFVQHQFVVPLDADDVVREALATVAASRPANFLNVLKRFGPGSDRPLSFPMPGWTLTMDLPATAEVASMLRGLDERVLAAGGRHYLAKDALVSPAVVSAGYPDLERFRSVRDRVDPNRVWCSDLSRRLGL